MKKIIFTIIFVFAFITTAFAETSIKATVDKLNLSTDEILIYKLSITSAEKKLPAPEIPKFEGFSILSQVQSSTMTLVKSKIQSTLIYEFILAPVKAGKLKIEPSSIKINGKDYSTDAFDIEVSQGKIQPEPEAPQTTL